MIARRQRFPGACRRSTAVGTQLAAIRRAFAADARWRPPGPFAFALSARKPAAWERRRLNRLVTVSTTGRAFGEANLSGAGDAINTRGPRRTRGRGGFRSSRRRLAG